MVYIRKFELITGKDSFTDITKEVKEAIASSNIRNGIVTVETPHSTAGIFKITNCGNEVIEDIVREMRRIVPARINFRHQDSPEDSAGHIKSCLFSSSVSLILEDGKLLCEEKQEICFADYDGPRERTYSVCVVGE